MHLKHFKILFLYWILKCIEYIIARLYSYIRFKFPENTIYDLNLQMAFLIFNKYKLKINAHID